METRATTCLKHYEESDSRTREVATKMVLGVVQAEVNAVLEAWLDTFSNHASSDLYRQLYGMRFPENIGVHIPLVGRHTEQEGLMYHIDLRNDCMLVNPLNHQKVDITYASSLPQQVYECQHYKNKKIYTVYGEAKCQSTGDTLMVYADENNLWLRPLEMFLEDVEYEGKMVPRFKRV